MVDVNVDRLLPELESRIGALTVENIALQVVVAELEQKLREAEDALTVSVQMQERAEESHRGRFDLPVPTPPE
jgi:hypothetical protein